MKCVRTISSVLCVVFSITTMLSVSFALEGLQLVKAGFTATPEKEVFQKKELSEAHLNPNGVSVMKQAADTCTFDEPPDGIEAVIGQMKAIFEKIKNIPGRQEAYEQGY